MMRILFLFASILICQFINSQVVSSSCYTTDIIFSQLKDDADQLTLRRIYRNQLTYKDSIEIPKTLSNPILKALISVYNSTSISSRDTVIKKFDIHASSTISLKSIIITADSNLTWMEQLKKGILPTGDTVFDKLVRTYHFKLDKYYNYTYPYNCHNIVLKSDSNYNIKPLEKAFKNISGVYSAEMNYMIGDGNDITDSVYSNYIELIYSYGWGDCPSGCIDRRYWKFKVFDNCNVEYVSSYGSKLGFSDNKINSISISPNPFEESIELNGFKNNCNYKFSSILGEDLYVGKLYNNKIQNLKNLKSGIYILTLYNKEFRKTIKVIKK